MQIHIAILLRYHTFKSDILIMASILQPATHNLQNSQLIMLNICPKFHEKTLKDFRVIERTRPAGK